MSELPYTSDSPEPAGKRAASQALNSFVFIDSKLLEIQTVQIHAAEGTIWATPNGGALRTELDRSVRWESDQPFTLSFVQLGGTPQPLGPLSAHWDERERAYCVVALMKSGKSPPFYEYTVKVGDLTLDPIVIVDKH